MGIVREDFTAHIHATEQKIIV